MMEVSYKKQSTGCGPCILSPIFRVYRTDMNLAFALSCIMAVVWLFYGKCEGTSGHVMASNMHRRLRNRPLLRGYTVEDLVDREEDDLEVNKRQQFDDYGHMRFGKREQFDDYGHMRFGRKH